jgi:UMF1 family MFS transporter
VKPRLAWALIDWANSAFALTVMTAFFPVFFGKYWCDTPGLSPQTGTLYLGIANSLYALLIALTAPILGAVADQGGAKKRFLIVFTLLGALSTALLPLVARGDYLIAASLFVVASFGFSGNCLFYDALLMDVAGSRDFDRVSSFGYALGYLGSELLFILNTLMVMFPGSFGLSPGAEGRDAAVKISFALTGAWWLLFTVPAWLWIKEAPAPAPALPGSHEGVSHGIVWKGFAQFLGTLKELRSHRTALLFLTAYILYIDGINTVISMAVDFGEKIGLDDRGLILALHLTQWIAFPATLLYSGLGAKTGAKNAIGFGILVYAGICLWAYRMTCMAEFWVLAAVVGLVQGGVQALSRSFFARLVPKGKSGEFFGFFNTMGKFAAVMGPLLMGVSARLFGSRASVLSLLLLFAAGGLVLMKVPDKA